MQTGKGITGTKTSRADTVAHGASVPRGTFEVLPNLKEKEPSQKDQDLFAIPEFPFSGKSNNAVGDLREQKPRPTACLSE